MVSRKGSPFTLAPQPVTSHRSLVTVLMLSPGVAAGVNHLLRSAAWARDELRRHAGKTARFELAPLAISLTVLDSGQVSAAAAGTVCTVTLKLTPGLLLRLAARDESAWKEIAIAGDTDFAAAIHHLSHHLRWDIEEDLSRVFGDIAAHRMVETGRAFQRWGGQSLENVARSVTEYWTEEQPLIASARSVREFVADVDTLRDDVARLEKRVELLVKHQDARGSRSP